MYSINQRFLIDIVSIRRVRDIFSKEAILGLRYYEVVAQNL